VSNNDKQLFSFTVSEIEKKNMKDYRFDASFSHAGMRMSFGCSMDEIRDFLSRRRAAKEEKATAQG